MAGRIPIHWRAAFIGLATRVIPEDQAAQIAAVKNLEEVKDLRDLTNLLVSPSSRIPSRSDRAGPPGELHPRTRRSAA
jgi:hypothetical protein